MVRVSLRSLVTRYASAAVERTDVGPDMTDVYFAPQPPGRGYRTGATRLVRAAVRQFTAVCLALVLLLVAPATPSRGDGPGGHPSPSAVARMQAAIDAMVADGVQGA